MMLSINAMIERGYLPYEVIPAFNTKSLSDAIINIVPHLDTFSHNKERKYSQYSQYSQYSIPKVKHLRRILAIPNPLYQIRLCKLIVDNWADIKTFLDKSKLSRSTPIISNPFLTPDEKRTFYRPIKIADIPKWHALFSNNARYMLKTDLSRFFPTTYTHIIPWALHTKTISKLSMNDKVLFKSLLGNALDQAVRDTQDKQTLGIPIGPDSSLVISEIIGTAIDVQFVNRLNSAKIKYKGFRFVDDFYLFFRKLADAEYALSSLYAIVNSYELELNSEKTQIVELPDILDSKWVLELRGLPIEANSGKSQSDNLIAYFSKAFELSKQFPEDSVLKYALNEIADVTIEKDYWSLYEALILKSMIAEPAVLPTATEIFIAYLKLKYPLNKEAIRETLFELILYHSQYEHSHEVAWALWLCKSLNLRVTKEISAELSTVTDCTVALVALDLFEQGLIKVLDKSKWEPMMRVEELYSNNWLLTYEAYIKGWLRSSDGSDYIANDPFFKLLRDNNVSFYNRNNQVTPALISVGQLNTQKTIANRERRRRNRGY